MLIIISLVIFILICIYFILKKKHSYWSDRGVPQIEPTFLIGNFKEALFGTALTEDIVLKSYRDFKKAGLKHGGIYSFYIPIWIPTDLDIIKNILNKDFWSFSSHGILFQHPNDMFSNNIFNLKGNAWKNMRSKLSTTLSSSKIKLMFGIIDDLSDRLETKVTSLYKNNCPFDVKQIAEYFIIDATANCFLGLETNCLENEKNDFYKYTEICFKRTSFRAALEQNFNWSFLSFLGYTVYTKASNHFFFNLLRRIVDNREKRNIYRNDMLQQLIEFKNRKENNITSKELISNALLIILAAFEASSTAIEFTMYELARNPDIQEKVRAEIIDISKRNDDNKIKYEDLQDMKYTDMVIQEALRLHTVASLIFRECTTEYSVPGTNVILEKGTAVFIPTWAIHKDPEFYPHPEQFDPENFNKLNKSERSSVQYLAFGEGPRICLGKLFGITNMKMFLIKALRKFKYSLNPATPHKISYSSSNVTIYPKEKVLLDISPIPEEKKYQ